MKDYELLTIQEKIQRIKQIQSMYPVDSTEYGKIETQIEKLKGKE